MTVRGRRRGPEFKNETVQPDTVADKGFRLNVEGLLKSVIVSLATALTLGVAYYSYKGFSAEQSKPVRLYNAPEGTKKFFADLRQYEGTECLTNDNPWRKNNPKKSISVSNLSDCFKIAYESVQKKDAPTSTVEVLFRDAAGNYSSKGFCSYKTGTTNCQGSTPNSRFNLN